MAPQTQQDIYFPSLDTLLSGHARLLSWSAAHRAFCSTDHALSNTTLQAFIRSAETTSCLQSPFEPFPTPSPKSKAEFETKTAAIHVLPSQNGGYDIAQLKEDALWLGREADVEECIALRVVLLEWQTRPAARLLKPVDAVPRSTARDTKDAPRERITELFVAEKSAILSLAAALLGFARPLKAPEVADSTLPDASASSWIVDSAAAILQTRQPGDWLENAIASLGGQLGRADELVSLDSPDFAAADICFASSESIARLIFTVANWDSDFSAETLLAWFNLMARVKFLSTVPIVTATQQILAPTLQTLVSLISVALLKLPASLARVETVATASQQRGSNYPVLPTVAPSSYLEDVACVKKLNIILLSATLDGNAIASPAILAWSIITQLIREHALVDRMEREHRIDADHSSSDMEGDAAGLGIDTPTVLRRSSLRRNAAPSVPGSKLENLLEALQDASLPAELRDNPMIFMTEHAVDDLGAFAVVQGVSDQLSSTSSARVDQPLLINGKLVLLQLVRESLAVTAYTEEKLTAFVSLVTLPRELTSLGNLALHSDAETVGKDLVNTADQRSPWELSPLLRTITALCELQPAEGTAYIQLADNTNIFTQVFPHTSSDWYETVAEDEGRNQIMLMQDMPLFRARRGDMLVDAPLLISADSEVVAAHEMATMIIPNGTLGTVVSPEGVRPRIVQWQHHHSGLAYLGALLATRRANATTIDAFKLEPLDAVTAADAISLITTLMSSAMGASSDTASALHVLGRTSNALGRGEDVVTIIADIFDEELGAQLQTPRLDGSIELLVACAAFMTALVDVSPERVWAALARCSLLGGHASGSGSLVSIVSAAEAPAGAYPFLSACVQLYARLVQDALTGCVKRRVATKPNMARFDSPMSSPGGTPERVIRLVLEGSTRIYVHLVQTLPAWKCVDFEQRLVINETLFAVLAKVLRSTYGVDGSVRMGAKLAACLAPSATIIAEAFEGRGGTDDPLAAILSLGLAVLQPAMPTQTISLAQQQTISVLTFATSLLDIHFAGPKNSYHGPPERLLRLVTLIANLYTVDVSYRAPIARLLARLVQALISHDDDDEPPSLLSQLGPEAATAFLTILADLDQPLRDLDTEIALWNLLSALVSSTQQWFAIYLTTGTAPRERLKSDSTTRSKSLLTHALDELAGIASIPPHRATAMLAFVAAAQRNCIWVSPDVRSYTNGDFISAATVWLRDLTAPTRSSDLVTLLHSARQYAVAAHLCDILAEVFRHAGDLALLRQLLPRLAFLRDGAVAVDAYNTSLHDNLARNVAAKYGGCAVVGFERTAAAGEAELGRGYFYDVGFAGEVLGFAPAWLGLGKGRAQGFRDEFERANVNLSMVEAQGWLLRKWTGLATQLAVCVDEEPKLQPELAAVVGRCLAANMEASLPHTLVADTNQVRADLAFVCLQRLVAVKALDPAVTALLPKTCALLRACSSDFDVATSPAEYEYYRTLLRILFLALQPLRYTPLPPHSSQSAPRLDPALAATLVELVAKPICASFRALCAALHASDSAVSAADFALLTALLHSILTVPGATALSAQLAAAVAATGAIRHALSLYSWAPALATAHSAPDPLFAAAAALAFLAQLSTVPDIALLLAQDAALPRLAAAPLTAAFRRPAGCGPFDHHQPRLHALWAHGLLPLCLNLLAGVGPPVGPDVAAFLAAFPDQLHRAQGALSGGAVTLGVGVEVHALALLGAVLDVRGFERGVAGAAVEGLSRGLGGLAERVVPVGEQERGWYAMPAKGGGVENELVRRVGAELEGAARCLSLRGGGEV